MATPNRRPDTGPLFHPLYAALEIGNAEQQMIGGGDGRHSSSHDGLGSRQCRGGNEAERPQSGSTIGYREDHARILILRV